MYPHLSPFDRETLICRKYKAVFIIGIGAKLRGGMPHDGRAPDYDDWISVNNSKGYRGLNGDILIYYPLFDKAFEISSMGIRVDRESMVAQLKESGRMDKLDLM